MSETKTPMVLEEVLTLFLDEIREYESEAGKPVSSDDRSSSEFVNLFLHKNKPILALEAQLHEGNRRLQELESLFELQHKRTVEADKLWQKEQNKAGVLPDLGELIRWLTDRATKAETELNEARTKIEQQYNLINTLAGGLGGIHERTRRLPRQLSAAIIGCEVYEALQSYEKMREEVTNANTTDRR